MAIGRSGEMTIDDCGGQPGTPILNRDFLNSQSLNARNLQSNGAMRQSRNRQ
jgi:hypothetical protein